MLGVTQPDDVQRRLEALLFDDKVRQRMTRVVGVSSHEDQRRGSARAADRAADAVLELRSAT
jgi:hypothetical protein